MYSNRQHRKEGFTLVEILLALCILVIGLVGVLAIFPVGINCSRSAVEQNRAALLAESVKDSLVHGFRTTPPLNTKVSFSPGGNSNKVTFFLPTSGTVVDLPQDLDAQLPTQNRPVFQADFDPQYSFRVQIEKDNSSSLVDNLYQIHVHVYRNYVSQDWSRDLDQDANHTGERGSSRVPVRLISSYKTLVSSK